jgi:hypothetical protein
VDWAYNMLDKEDIHIWTYLYLSHRAMKEEETVAHRPLPRRLAYAQVGRRIDYSHDATNHATPRQAPRSALCLAKHPAPLLASPSQVTRTPHTACS